MNVGDLISELQKCDQALPVVIEPWVGELKRSWAEDDMYVTLNTDLPDMRPVKVAALTDNHGRKIIVSTEAI
jgi:hypothetical protein